MAACILYLYSIPKSVIRFLIFWKLNKTLDRTKYSSKMVDDFINLIENYDRVSSLRIFAFLA